MLVCAFGKGSSSKSPTFTTFCKANFHFIYVLDFRFNEDVIGNTVVAARVALMEIRGSRKGEASRRVKIDRDDCTERGATAKTGGVFIGGISTVLCSVPSVSNWPGWVVQSSTSLTFQRPT